MPLTSEFGMGPGKQFAISLGSDMVDNQLWATFTMDAKLTADAAPPFGDHRAVRDSTQVL